MTKICLSNAFDLMLVSYRQCLCGKPGIQPNEESKIIIRLLSPINYWDCYVSGWALGQGSFYTHEITIPISIGVIERCNQ